MANQTVCSKLLFTAILLSQVTFLYGGKGFFNFKSFSCEASDEYFYPNFSCYAKSWSRNFSTLNGHFYIKKPFYKVWVSFLIFHLRTKDRLKTIILGRSKSFLQVWDNLSESSLFSES